MLFLCGICCKSMYEAKNELRSVYFFENFLDTEDTPSTSTISCKEVSKSSVLNKNNSKPSASCKNTSNSKPSVSCKNTSNSKPSVSCKNNSKPSVSDKNTSKSSVSCKNTSKSSMTCKNTSNSSISNSGAKKRSLALVRRRSSTRAFHPFRFDLNTLKCSSPRIVVVRAPESMVATKCGHVFHKECIYKYMRAYRAEFRESSVECPTCQGRVLCAGTFPLDLGASEECSQQADNDVKVLRTVHGELLDQMEEVNNKLLGLKEHIMLALEYRNIVRCVRAVFFPPDLQSNDYIFNHYYGGAGDGDYLYDDRETDEDADNE